MQNTYLKQRVTSIIGKIIASRNRKVYIIVLIILLPVFAEMWNLAHVWQAINRSATYGIRYGVTHDYNPNYCPYPCDSESQEEAARLRSIYDEIRYEFTREIRNEEMSSDILNITLCSNLPGYRYIKQENACIPHDNTGADGSQMTVGIVYEYPLGAMLGAGIPAIKISSRREGEVEGFRTSRIEGISNQLSLANDGGEMLVVVTGNVELIVDNIEKTADEVAQLANQVDGYVVESVIGNNDGQKYAEIQIRIPANEFEGTLEQVKAIANEVLQETISRKDVTEEYIDTEGRLHGLQATADQLNELLAQAQTVDEALNVAVEQGKLQEQIEQAQGKKEYLESQAALATLNILLTSKRPEVAQENVSWQVSKTFQNALNFLIALVFFIGDVLVWAIVVVLPIALLVWVIMKLITQFRKRNYRKE